jgi:UDP-glucose 4-epimerase
MELAGRRVVVTGGAGFIGSHVVDRLVTAGADVVAVDALSAGRRENLAEAEQRGARLLVGDVRDADVMNRVLDGAAAVIHMACDNLRASLAEPLRSHDVNATGTLVTALAAISQGVERFVYVSSSEAYGSARRVPMDEEHPLEPTTVYGAGKAAGELYAQACLRTYGLPVVVVRPFNSYGPRCHTSGTSAEVIPRFVARIRAGLPPVIFGDGSQARDFTWVEETADGIVAATAADELVGEAVNIAHGHPVAIREICDLLLEILGAHDLQPQLDAPRPGDVDRHYADTTKAKALLGFRATTSIRTGLERYVRWAREREVSASRAETNLVRNW